MAELRKTAALAMPEGDKSLLPPNTADKAKAAATEFSGLSNIIEQLREKTAGAGDEITKAISEVQHLTIEATKAEEKFAAMKKAGKLDAATVQREAEAMAQIPAALLGLRSALEQKIIDKHDEAVLEASEQLQ